jgi:hypothetical protein
MPDRFGRNFEPASSPKPRRSAPSWEASSITQPDPPPIATKDERRCPNFSTRLDARRLRLVDRAIADIVKRRRSR